MTDAEANGSARNGAQGSGAPESGAAESGPPGSGGLTSEEAEARLRQYGPNTLPSPPDHPLLKFLGKLWAPVPWMLEATVVLELILGRRVEAVAIALLLVMNALVSLLQERRAENALALLRRRLPVKARVLRDGRWQTIDAAGVVPGDRIYIRMGDIVPADLRIDEGEVSIDQSLLTGESLPVAADAGKPAYTGAIVRRGEASGAVTATGARTYFGRTANLVSTARTVSHLQTIIFRIVRSLVALDAVLVAALLVFSLATGLPLREMLPFALMLLVASVPVALPATFALATALGATELAKDGVMVTRLSAIEEAAAMDVLLSDKTGTITQNRLAVVALLPFAGFDEGTLLRTAALASDRAGQDPIDLAILNSAAARSIDVSAVERLSFVPFDPATKLCRATYSEAGRPITAVKGFPAAVAAEATKPAGWDAALDRLAGHGYRVLAVAAGSAGQERLCGLIGLEDPPRADSKSLIESLRGLGVRVIMVTGDAPQTAAVIAGETGIGTRIGDAALARSSAPGQLLDYDVFAAAFPEDKVALVRAMQAGGRVTGMTGDGVNDAPALKQAEVGIAVANATDVAKSAASVVLTNPGLGDILAAVRTSRQIYQRMLTYTLNKIIKTIEIALFLSLGVMLTRSFVITPLLIVLLLFTNDFVTMSIATDRVGFSPRPDRWEIGRLVTTAGSLSAVLLVFSTAVFFGARHFMHLPLPELQTLTFVMLVFTGQGTVYLVRERGRLWSSRPGRYLLLSSLGDIVVVTLMATRGILMTSIPLSLVAELLAATAVFMLGMDAVKVRIFQRFAIR